MPERNLHEPSLRSQDQLKILFDEALSFCTLHSTWLRLQLMHLFDHILTPDKLLNPHIGNPLEHHIYVLRHLMSIAQSQGVSSQDEYLELGALALLHDVCPTPKIPRELIEAAKTPEEKEVLAKPRVANRQHHMSQGSVMAREELLWLRAEGGQMSDDAVKRICAIIAIHDNPTIGQPILSSFDPWAVWLREADRLWMMTELGIKVDLTRRGILDITAHDFLDQAQRNVGKFLAERQLYKNIWESNFQDPYNLFRTQRGYELYLEYSARILEHGAHLNDYVLND